MKRYCVQIILLVFCCCAGQLNTGMPTWQKSSFTNSPCGREQLTAKTPGSKSCHFQFSINDNRWAIHSEVKKNKPEQFRFPFIMPGLKYWY